MYADYTFYTEEYKGNKIPEADFERLEMRASEDLDYMTPNRDLEKFLNLSEDKFPAYLKNIASKIKKATCAIAELNFEKEQYDSLSGVDEDGKGKAITQESRGTISVSFSRELSSTQQALADPAEFEKLKINTALKYLQGTSMMYRGVR